MGVLHDLHRHLQTRPHAPLPPALADDLRRALDAWEHGSSIQAAVAGRNIRRRDAAFRRAGELLAPSGGSWARANAVERAARRLLECRGATPRNEAERVLLIALESGRMPSTLRQLHRIMAAGGAASTDIAEEEMSEAHGRHLSRDL